MTYALLAVLDFTVNVDVFEVTEPAQTAIIGIHALYTGLQS